MVFLSSRASLSLEQRILMAALMLPSSSFDETAATTTLHSFSHIWICRTEFVPFASPLRWKDLYWPFDRRCHVVSPPSSDWLFKYRRTKGQ